jgi:hypothetical protein
MLNDTIKTKQKMDKPIEWINTSRLNTIRSYNLSNDKLTVICHEVSSYSFSFDEENNVVSLDPNGGPYFKIRDIVSYQNNKWIIQQIVSHIKKNNYAVFVFTVSKL